MLNFSILQTETELLQWRKQQKSEIAFVPTMGGLHDGHSQLIKTAKYSRYNDTTQVLVSVFVNPLQFGPQEDFESYPRSLQNDIEVASKSGAHAIWVPSINQIFPGGPESNFKLNVPFRLQAQLCGSLRNGHFDGVATVMIQLLKHIKPNFLVLGEKDWQQFIILRKLISDFNLPIKVRGIGTVRDIDGLAHSSRNQYLSKIDRENAIALPKELAKASHNALLGKVIDIKKIRSSLEQKGLEVEYLEVVDPHDLQPTQPTKHFSLLAAAIRCGRTRLIDHTFLMKRKPIVAIDGPAGAGKSTVTRAFAERLNLIYLDTGAMYRAVAWLIQDKGIDPKDPNQVAKCLENLKLELKAFGKNPQVIINENNVTDAIRSPSVTSIVSVVAAHHSVREALTSQQKQIGIDGGLVAEGRDIGTAVFPNAELKIFLTATTRERARRRILDLQNQGFLVPDFKDVEYQIKERDQMDSTRSISPLVKAEDAQEVVTDGMNIEEVTQVIEELFRLKVPEEVWPTPAQ